MPAFCHAARNATLSKAAEMLADEASTFEAYYHDDAENYRESNPDKYKFIRQQADDAGDLAHTLTNEQVSFDALAIAARRLAEQCLEVGDFEMHDEMAALASGFAAQAT